MLCHHLTFAVHGRLQAFLDERELRVAARTLARVAGHRLLSWGLPSDHLHLLVEGTRAEAGLLGRDLRFAFRALGTIFDEPHFRQITGRDHLENVVVYHLRQARKHGACDRPGLFSGGCFLDLVGARILEGYAPARVLAHLPRFDVARHLDEVAVRDVPAMIRESEIRSAGAARLVDASAAALGVGPLLSGHPPPVVAARRVAVTLGTAAGIPLSELAFAIGCTPQATGRIARLARDPKVERAVRLRLGLEAVALPIERSEPDQRAQARTELGWLGRAPGDRFAG